MKVIFILLAVAVLLATVLSYNASAFTSPPPTPPTDAVQVVIGGSPLATPSPATTSTPVCFAISGNHILCY